MPWTPITGHWYEMPEHWPADTLQCFVRRFGTLTAPFKCTFDLATYTFTTVAESLDISWIWIAKWKQP